MTVKLLVDMNLSPDWVPVLKSHGWSVVVNGRRPTGQ